MFWQPLPNHAFLEELAHCGRHLCNVGNEAGQLSHQTKEAAKAADVLGHWKIRQSGQLFGIGTDAFVADLISGEGETRADFEFLDGDGDVMLAAALKNIADVIEDCLLYTSDAADE